jgi:hypothetical protein
MMARMSFQGTALRLLFSVLALALVTGTARAARAAPEPEVLVILWFDTEDYMLPASDDAAKRVAEILTARSIRGTFKLVGEKARVLERRGRTDVIAALKRHDIGYHSNFHSVHPTPSEYLADCGWAEGVAEFVRREGGGAADVRRILGVETLACYGQPGSSWGPQTIGGLKAIGVAPHGVPCYVDEGSHVGLDGRPFWYIGALNVYHMGDNYTRMELHEAGGLEKGCERFRAIHDRMRKEGGGLISIFYHPAEWVHREFWDGVNFRRGANPPREEWKPPPQRPAAETDAAYERFEKYIDFQRSLPGVRFITASDLPELYGDQLPGAVGPDSALALARAIAGSSELDFQKDDQGRFYSPAEQFLVLVDALSRSIEAPERPMKVFAFPALGPAEPPPATEVDELPWTAFRDAVLAVREHLDLRVQPGPPFQIPSRVFAGVKKIAPADFLAACAPVAAEVLSHEGKPRFPEKVKLPRGIRLATETRIAKDEPGLFGGWIIHVEGFRAPRILEQARLQAWTLKPARRAAVPAR